MRTIQQLWRGSASSIGGRGAPPWWLMWLVFLPFGAPVIAALLQSHPSPLRLVASLAGAALFLAAYVWTAWQGGKDMASPTPLAPPTEALLWLPLALMTALAVLLVEADGPGWGALFIFTIAAAGGRLPLRQALLAIGALMLLIVVGGWRDGMGSGDIVQAAIAGGVTAAATLTVVQSVRTNRKLRMEREEMARYAGVAAERLRIARDLHDLLGHSLSLIALKSELAGRLAPVAPEQAVAEIRDIEDVARTALQEVREAVAGYRLPTLADELRAAREILAAAGISYRTEDEDDVIGRFPPAVEATLAWAVREGVTNVIRHSHAQSCCIRVLVEGDIAQLEIVDDGDAAPDAPSAPGTPGTPAERPGSGLRGLAERVEVLGGRCEAGPLPAGGFRLAVWLPIAARTPSIISREPATVLIADDPRTTRATSAGSRNAAEGGDSR